VIERREALLDPAHESLLERLEAARMTPYEGF
jgi:hypothetical protein